MSKSLEHRQIHGVLTALGDAKIVNLDASVKSLITPVGESMAKLNPGAEVSLHILCCNEYALVTGLTGTNIDDIQRLADSIRSSIAR